ncbi:hypothetical protein Dimus_037427 [Dionaea muscipula]
MVGELLPPKKRAAATMISASFPSSRRRHTNSSSSQRASASTTQCREQGTSDIHRAPSSSSASSSEQQEGGGDLPAPLASHASDSQAYRARYGSTCSRLHVEQSMQKHAARPKGPYTASTCSLTSQKQAVMSEQPKSRTTASPPSSAGSGSSARAGLRRAPYIYIWAVDPLPASS